MITAILKQATASQEEPEYQIPQGFANIVAVMVCLLKDVMKKYPMPNLNYCCDKCRLPDGHIHECPCHTPTEKIGFGTMDIYAKKGDKVKFLGKNGYDLELENAKNLLEIGGIYEVESVDVGQSSSSVYLKGIFGRNSNLRPFNTVMFADVDEKSSPKSMEWEDFEKFKYWLYELDEVEIVASREKIIENVKHLLLSKETEVRHEERQFILNILDGIDIADEQMGNKGGGTKAIRLALKSRFI